MCEKCWRDGGCPAIDNAAVRVAAKAADDVYEIHCIGGRLHILLDDWHVGDGDLDWLRKYMSENEADSAEQDVAERFCLEAFSSLSVEERLSVLALQEGFWGSDVS